MGKGEKMEGKKKNKKRKQHWEREHINIQNKQHTTNLFLNNQRQEKHYAQRLVDVLLFVECTYTSEREGRFLAWRSGNIERERGLDRQVGSRGGS